MQVPFTKSSVYLHGNFVVVAAEVVTSGSVVVVVSVEIVVAMSSTGISACVSLITSYKDFCIRKA